MPCWNQSNSTQFAQACSSQGKHAQTFRFHTFSQANCVNACIEAPTAQSLRAVPRITAIPNTRPGGNSVTLADLLTKLSLYVLSAQKYAAVYQFVVARNILSCFADAIANTDGTYSSGGMRCKLKALQMIFCAWQEQKLSSIQYLWSFGAFSASSAFW